MSALDDFYGDWSVGLGIEVIEADGTPMRWSEFVVARGLEDDARRTAESRMLATLRQDYPNARKRLVLALASDPIEGTGL